MPEDEDYGLSPTKSSATIDPPEIGYRPPLPRDPSQFPIGIIGTGGIAEFHLRNYASAGFPVVALTNRSPGKAEALRDQFFPDAEVCSTATELLNRQDIAVVDVTPHPEDRIPLIHEALDHGKHVLSQKPFALDLETGRNLVQKADAAQLQLAVNQNGRWAPHFSWMRHAIATGLIGEVRSVDFNLQWDQTWTAGNPSFESIHHLVLFDFAIHWFDITRCFLEHQSPIQVAAHVTRFPGQLFGPPALASATVQYPAVQARFSFNAHTTLGEEDSTTIVGSHGTLRSRGPSLNHQPEIEVYLQEGHCRVPLEGCWFEDGFAGTMGELLCSIENQRTPYHAAAHVLPSLELCFAAMQSADQGGQPVSL